MTVCCIFESFYIFAPMSRKIRHDILVKRNSMLSESPPRNKRVIVNLIESVPMLRRGLSHIRFTACGEPRQRMTKVCAFYFISAMAFVKNKAIVQITNKTKDYEKTTKCNDGIDNHMFGFHIVFKNV